MLETTFTPTLPEIRFNGWPRREKPEIVGPETGRDLDPEYPGTMPKYGFPDLERRLRGNAGNHRRPHGPDELLPGRPELYPCETELFGPAPAEIVVPLPPDVMVKDGEELIVTLPELGKEIEYRLDRVA